MFWISKDSWWTRFRKSSIKELETQIFFQWFFKFCKRIAHLSFCWIFKLFCILYSQIFWDKSNLFLSKSKIFKSIWSISFLNESSIKPKLENKCFKKNPLKANLMGWLTGFEPATSGVTVRCSTNWATTTILKTQGLWQANF